MRFRSCYPPRLPPRGRPARSYAVTPHNVRFEPLPSSAVRGDAMVEIGVAILFLGVLIAADRKRTQQATDQVRRFLDWVERSQ